MHTRFVPFAVGYILTVLLFILVTLLAAHVQSDCGLPGLFGVAGCSDAISRAGFPLVFWEEGGFVYHGNFNLPALLVDLAIGVGAGIIIGVLVQRRRSRREVR